MSRRRGNENENLFMALAEKLGYCAFAARGSRGAVDVVCFDDHRAFKAESREFWGIHRTALVAQVGTAAKPIAATLAELDAAPRPIGSLCIVARRMPLKGGRRPWRFHTPYGTFDDLAEAIAAR